MKNLIILLVLSLLFISNKLFAQDYYFVTAENGLNVRSSTDLFPKKIALLPFGMRVEKIADTEKELVIYENGHQISGKFVKIKYSNYPYLISEETDAFEKEGYVFDGYLKREQNDHLIRRTMINEKTYAKLFEKAPIQVHKPKVIRCLEAIKTILKEHVEWVSEFESNAYKRDDVIKSITTESGRILLINQNSNDFGFAQGYSGYYPEDDILVLEGGHNYDACFSIKTGETEHTIGNPEYMISSPKNSYRLNGSFGGQECISYFIQKNENGKFVYFTALNPDDICTFSAFHWISETSFIYKTINYRTNSENGTEDFFMGEITNNTK